MSKTGQSGTQLKKINWEDEDGDMRKNKGKGIILEQELFYDVNDRSV